MGVKPLIGAEIGVRAGENTLNIVKSEFIGKLYLIDHYEAHVESSGIEITKEQQKDFYYKMFKNLHPYIDKLVFVSVASDFASTLFEDGYFDFVYIDAGHKYDEVQKDMSLWLPKVKYNGILCGHDFNNVSTPEVAKAVKDFCSARNLPVYHLGDLDWATYRF